jgi:hypothetical protein
LGQLLEALLSQEGLRKQRGRFYTPRAVVDDVVSRAMSPFLKDERAFPRVIDPACGGGAFLFGVARALLSRIGKTEGNESGDRSLRRAIFDVLHGYDIEPLAVAVTEIALAIWAGAASDVTCSSRSRFVAKDSLLGTAHDAARNVASEASVPHGTSREEGSAHFDLVIGNPPWVAYAGRATQPLAPERRRWLTENYPAFRGYPTLQACFVELATRLSPRGRIALLVPSAVADLDGYRPMRRVLSKHHRVSEELVEYGQDAFDGVVQPCFALIADADKAAIVSDAPFTLVERSGIESQAKRVEPPDVLSRLRKLAPFSAECFRELGFQTTTVVTKTLLLRSIQPSPPFALPLLEGRDVTAFVVGEPKLFLNPDSDVLRSARCRLRHPGEYKAVDFVIRQTAKYPIAALHSGHAFRNSLIAGFGCGNHPPSVLVGLLNSTLLRALHLAEQRDGRQKTFPQVKLLHLRSLPAPPRALEVETEFEKLVQSLSGSAPSREDCRRLDALVFDWYGVPADEAAAVERFFIERS